MILFICIMILIAYILKWFELLDEISELQNSIVREIISISLCGHYMAQGAVLVPIKFLFRADICRRLREFSIDRVAGLLYLMGQSRYLNQKLMSRLP